MFKWKYLHYKPLAALSSAPLHAMHSELGGKCGTECLNIRYPLPTLLCPHKKIDENLKIFKLENAY